LIYYLKTDPHFNCDNPKAELEKEKEKNSSKKDLFFGIFWGVLALLGVVSTIGAFLTKKEITVTRVLVKNGETIKNAHQIQNLKNGPANAPIFLDDDIKDSINRMSKPDVISFCSKKFNLSIKDAKTFVAICKSLK